MLAYAYIRCRKSQGSEVFLAARIPVPVPCNQTKHAIAAQFVRTVVERFRYTLWTPLPPCSWVLYEFSISATESDLSVLSSLA